MVWPSTLPSFTDLTVVHDSDLTKIVDALKALTEWQTMTPSWTAPTATPILGNGSLVTSYVKAGNLTLFSMLLTFGSNTDPGNGQWSFTLPTTPLSSARTSFTGTALDSSAGQIYPVVATRATSSSTVALRCDPTTAGNPLRNLGGVAVPFAWESGDALEISGFYPSAP